jgi:hypothetical protein
MRSFTIFRFEARAEATFAPAPEAVADLITGAISGSLDVVVLELEGLAAVELLRRPVPAGAGGGVVGSCAAGRSYPNRSRSGPSNLGLVAETRKPKPKRGRYVPVAERKRTVEATLLGPKATRAMVRAEANRRRQAEQGRKA